MTVITVNGGALQPAIDAASAGDTIAPTPGTYAGRLKITKPLTLELGAAIIDGGQGDGFYNVDVAAKNVVIRDGDIRHAGCGIRFKGDCTGSLVSRTVIPTVDWMVRNTTVKGDDTGGMGILFERASGVTVEDVRISRCRAVSLDYGRDGAAFEFFVAKNITIRRAETWDNVVVAEFGKNSTDPNNADILIEDCTFHGRPDQSVPAGSTTVANGIYARALDRFTLQRNTFDRLDWWGVVLSMAGNFAGPFSAVQMLGNTWRLLPGVNRILTADSGVPLDQVMLDSSRIYVSGPSVLAEVFGKRYADLASLRAGVPAWEVHNAFYGAEPPPDPCAPVKAALADMTSQRDALQSKVDAAKAALA